MSKCLDLTWIWSHFLATVKCIRESPLSLLTPITEHPWSCYAYGHNDTTLAQFSWVERTSMNPEYLNHSIGEQHPHVGQKARESEGWLHKADQTAFPPNLKTLCLLDSSLEFRPVLDAEGKKPGGVLETMAPFGPAATALRRSLLSSTAAHRNRDTGNVLEASAAALPRLLLHGWSGPGARKRPCRIKNLHKSSWCFARARHRIFVYIAPDLIWIWIRILYTFLFWRPTCIVGSSALIDQYELRPA